MEWFPTEIMGSRPRTGLVTRPRTADNPPLKRGLQPLELGIEFNLDRAVNDALPGGFDLGPDLLSLAGEIGRTLFGKDRRGDEIDDAGTEAGRLVATLPVRRERL